MTHLTQDVKLAMVWGPGTQDTPRFQLQLPDFDEPLILGWRRLRSWKSVQRACREEMGQPSAWEPESGWHWRAILAELLFEISLGLWYKVHPAPGLTIRR